MNGKYRYYIPKITHVIALFVLSSVLIGIAGYSYFINEEKNIRQQKQNEIKAITELKIKQISGWYLDELADAGIISKNSFLMEKVDDYLKNKGILQKSKLINSISEIKTEHGYDDILICSLEGDLFVSVNNRIFYIDSLIKENIILSAKTNSTVVSDLFKSSAQKGKINLAFISPIVNENNQSIASAVFLIEADEFLYPLIQYWPTSSTTSETFIVRKEYNGKVLYLNELRHQKNTALQFWLPITRKDLPAVQAANGKIGIFEGKDYRGIEVFAYLSPIPETPWFMIAKINKSELFDGLYDELIIISTMTLLFILITGIGISLIYNNRQKNFYKELYNKEKELWQSEEKFKVTLESLGNGVITTDISGKVQYLNKMAEVLTGWNSQEAKGKSLSEVYSVKNENSGEKENNIIDKVLKQGVVKELGNHTLLISRSGDSIPVRDTGAPIYDVDGSLTGLVLTFQDETEKRRQLNLISESEEKYRTLIEISRDGLIIVLDDNIVFVNNAAIEILGAVKAEQLLGKSPLEFLNPDSIGINIERRKRMLEDGMNILNIEEKINRLDGNSIDIEIAAIPFNYKNRRAIQIIFRNISERKKMITDLISAKEKAEEINKLKTNFFANMSHELRTPFVGIMGYAELLLESLTDPDQKEMAEGILNTSIRMKETLTKILNLTRFEFSSIEVSKNYVNLCTLLENIYKQFTRLAEKKNLSFEKLICFNSLYLYTDETLLSEILSNLISNAIIYTNAGKIILSADVSKKNDINFIVIKVSDTGIGIPIDKQDIIWEEFRQVSEGTTRSYQGTGLGLAIVKKYTMLLGGSVFLESEEGKGSTFILEFPAPDSSKSEIENEGKMTETNNYPLENNSSNILEKKKILYVEDDLIAIDIAKRILSKIYEIDFSDTAESALSKINGNNYDVILTDINLGAGENGQELTNLIRQHPNYKNVPIVAVTAFASEDDKKEFLSKGMTHFLAKPFYIRELLKVLEDIFNKV